MITWPASIVPASADYAIEYDVQMTVMRSGRVYTHGLPGARWVATLSFRAIVDDIGRGAVEALVARLRGGARELIAPHFGRPTPNGTLAGSPQVASAAAAGANTLALKNCNGSLRAGDIIGVGGQLLMVEADVSPSGGNMTVAISPALRSSAAVNAPVAWNRPTTTWIPKTSVAGPFPYLPGRVRPAFSIELVETY